MAMMTRWRGDGKARSSSIQIPVSSFSVAEVTDCVDLMHAFRLIFAARKQALKFSLSEVSGMAWALTMVVLSNSDFV